MEEAKALHQQQQQQQQQKLMLQHRQQQQQQHQQQQQQLLLLQQLQKQQQQQAAMSRFPSNIDVHLRPIRPPLNLQQNPNSSSSPSPNSIPNLLQNQNTTHPQPQQTQHSQQSQSQMQQQQQKMVQPGNQLELQMAYQDALRICRPDFKRPFSSLEDACERLLPYHVVADYEAEEDDRILDSDTTGQMLSRSQQWDNNICAKVAEFTATFEKQALAFNIISRKRALGEFRSEERLMIEQALLQEEKRAMVELRAEIESREKAGRDAHETKLRTMALMRAEQARAESQAHSESMARGPLRASAQANDSGRDMGVLDQGINPDEMMNGWGNNSQKDEKEPSEDFLNDEETENGETGTQEVWRGVGEFDLNSR